MKVIFSLFLIIVGIVVAAFPVIKAQYSLNHQEELLGDWEEISQDAKLSYTSLNDVFHTKKKPVQEETEALSSGELIGKIEIPQIDLRMPIVEGATLENMKNAAGHLEGTGQIGEQGNAAVAAHRSYTYGKDFNRLDEIVVGDEINITTREGTYRYVVFNTTIVLPEDTSILKSKQDKSVLTLITCEPMKDPTHRLIVQASLENYIK
ncbi:class D sortase [Pseudalkalibacillus decolorationis]|uniref:class D sortase n=1 Tax=Pseudalkalibacillus decolorationis TaxID=163879 RepID=UPI002149159A|nr:class D sortase [Pseudalkalibacillus decolorationis]